jgi:hypothetical protein
MKASEPHRSRSFLFLNRRHEFRLRRRFGFRFVCALVIGLGVALTGRAGVVVYDNLGSAPYDTDGYSTFGLYSDGDRYQRGIQFTPSQTVKLSTLKLALGEAFFTSGNSAQSGTARVQLMTDSNNAPATALESWTSATISGGPGNGSVQTFTSLLTPTLTAGSNYWIVCDAPNSNLGGAWYFADDSHTGTTDTMWANVTTGSTTFTTLTRGFRTQITGVGPSLSITRTATNTIVLSWPAFAAGWMLEHTNSLSNATSPWPQYSPPYSATSTNFFFVLTNKPAVGNQFFRLQEP